MIQDIVLAGINHWNNANNQEPVDALSAYAPPLIRYAIEDWLEEYTFRKDFHPDKTFSTFIKEQEHNVIFSFKQSLTHKAHTVYRQAHAVLWCGLSQNEQDALLFGLRHLIHQTN